MLGPLSSRLLTLFQFTRMALVFTAISNLQAAYLLTVGHQAESLDELLHRLDPVIMLALALISIGLYGFGMSLNDIVDQRRDAQIAADRPLPSGRLGVRLAHLICVALACLAAGGSYILWKQLPMQVSLGLPTPGHVSGIFSSLISKTLSTTSDAAAASGQVTSGQAAVALVVLCGAMIVFYDVAGKYLVALGLLTLGLIRFSHAVIAEPLPVAGSPTLIHAVVLLVHITTISTIAYALERKRPSLTGPHVLIVAMGVLAVVLAVVATRVRNVPAELWAAHLGVTPAVFAPLLAACVFAAIAYHRVKSKPDPRLAGKDLMLLGLLWLIVYDAAFVGARVHWAAGLVLALFLPLAYASVRVMRLWSAFSRLAKAPDFIRAS